ncbi:MAG: hypothetical protein EON54_20045 [Alcaligenaceae bacterium]|nr:MAG: hypothetical protein EON54_20045 [Alcaligenaceae bacterium]
MSKHAVSSESVDVSRYLMDLFFDVISDLTFGESFDALTTGVRDPIVGEFLRHQKSAGVVMSNMCIFHLLRSIPAVASRLLYVVQWYASAVSKRGEVRERSSRKREWYERALKNRAQVRQPRLLPGHLD